MTDFSHSHARLGFAPWHNIEKDWSEDSWTNTSNSLNTMIEFLVAQDRICAAFLPIFFKVDNFIILKQLICH